MKLSILGCGVMGRGIASVALCSDKVTSVVLWGHSESSRQAIMPLLKKELRRSAKLNGLSREYAEKALEEKFSLVSDLSEIKGSDFCIEAVSESVDVKCKLVSQASEVLGEDTIFATNTSSLSITQMAIQYKYPQRFIGLHFFNPAAVMGLVEIVKGLTTSLATLDSVSEFVEVVGKKPVHVNESPGFVVNRMLIPMINEAVTIFSEGVASMSDIDKAMVLGANHPVGPFGLADLIGIDICLAIMESLHSETGDPKYRPHYMLRQHARAGFLGRKSGKGFYDYRK